MKKILTGIVLALCLSLLFSCLSLSGPAPISYLDADAGSGSTLIIGQYVTIDTFDGAEVGWRGTRTITGGFDKATMYIPSGLHSFTASAGLLKQQFDFSFAPGERYTIYLSSYDRSKIFIEKIN